MMLFKLEFDLFATMKQRRKYKKHNDGRCPRCARFNEDFNHVVRCPQNHSSRSKAWKEIWSVRKCREIYMSYVVNKFISGIEKWVTEGIVWWEGDIPPPSDTIGYTTFEAFIDQKDIGWDQAIRGRISVKWGKANASYCKERFLYSNPTIDDQWTTSKLINKLWNFGIGKWTSRNQFLYGVTDDKQIDILSKEAD